MVSWSVFFFFLFNRPRVHIFGGVTLLVHIKIILVLYPVFAMSAACSR